MGVNLWMTLLIGLTLGIKHALEPNHVIAVSTMVSRAKKLWTASVLCMILGLMKDYLKYGYIKKNHNKPGLS